MSSRVPPLTELSAVGAYLHTAGNRLECQEKRLAQRVIKKQLRPEETTRE